MAKNLIIGIDNGKNGAITVLDSDCNITEKHIMPVVGNTKKAYDIKRIYDILGQYKGNAVCCLEKAQPQGNNGPKQAFMTGYGYGVIQGILTTLDIPFIIVAPKIWQKKVFEGLSIKDTKLASLLFCKRRWPKESWMATERCRKEHDGLTDATCIAYYGVKNL